MLKVGNGERRRTHDVDIEISAFLPPVKTEVCAAAFMAWDRCRESRFPCNSLASRGKEEEEEEITSVQPLGHDEMSTTRTQAETMKNGPQEVAIRRSKTDHKRWPYEDRKRT
jgi:hypothetical protein